MQKIESDDKLVISGSEIILKSKEEKITHSKIQFTKRNLFQVFHPNEKFHVLDLTGIFRYTKCGRDFKPGSANKGKFMIVNIKHFPI